MANSNYDPTDLNAQELLRQESEEKRRLAQSQEDDDLKWLMGMKRGRKIMQRLIDESRCFTLPFDTNNSKLCANVGFAGFGFKQVAKLKEVCFELYQKMEQEAKEARNG